jgi:hypothetical protein
MFFLAGCMAGAAGRSVVVPPSEAISRIKVERSNGAAQSEYLAQPETPVIEDRTRIARISKFLDSHSRGWGSPWDTFPGCSYAITVESDRSSPLFLWVGGDWIGGRIGDGPRLKRLSRTEMRELQELIGIPVDP